ncbi:conjugative transposon protein TraM [Arcicella sp. LKC2W]|uniref:conjugative transposon protein TraM n=1 Tax=Arcicella sp. LKC2W TaxID=2984198 RepID=UPI002B1F248B|nr:conjugative transposon protein TraM [Arcicella sp. LKC2W]MEA5461635.1 conjugative transposon protein TraM [Arcicella sp. LKC2W]
MEKFFNLRFIKYPITLILNLILVGFYLYIFPPSEAKAQKSTDFDSVSLDIPLADKKIEERNVFSQVGEDTLNEFSALESQKDLEVKKENSKSDFYRRTAKSSPKTRIKSISSHQTTIARNHRNSILEANQEKSLSASIDKGHLVNQNAYQVKHQQTIERLNQRIQELEDKKKGHLTPQIANLSPSNASTIKSPKKEDGFNYNDDVLLASLATEDLLNGQSKNRFYSSHEDRNANANPQYSNVIGIQKTNSRPNKSINTLIRGRLMESKVVRNNTTIKIMLSESKNINGIAYQAGDILGAKTHLQGDRLLISVEGYLKNEVFVPLNAQVMDLDGLIGLKVSIDAENEMQKQAWGQNMGSTVGSVNPLLVYNPQGNLAQTVGNQVAGSLVNQSLNGANQYINAKIRDTKISITAGQQLFLLIKP